MSRRARLLNAWLRWVEKPALARAKGPGHLRRRMDVQAKLLFHAPRGTRKKWVTLDSGARQIDALEVRPRRPCGDLVLLYLHGGGFVFGSPQAYGAMAAQMSRRLQARAVLPRYRLAPENPFPAGLQDARSAWDGLLQSGISPARIILGGDSAGGAIALSLLAQLIADRVALPGGVFCFSPLTDMRFEGDSFRSNAQSEAVLPAARAHEMAQMYLAGTPTTDPGVSPLNEDFTGAPPIWITAADSEILRDDARRLVEKLRDAKVDITYTEVHDLPHVWPLFHNTLPEARKTLDDLAGWIRQGPGLPIES